MQSVNSVKIFIQNVHQTNEHSNNLFSKNNYLPNNICASPSLDKEKNLIWIGMDGDGKEKPRENNQLPAFERARNLPDMCENKNQTIVPA